MVERIEKFLFYFLIFSIPFQTRIIIKEWTLSFNEWTAGFVYLTDILLALVFALWLLRILNGRDKFSFTKIDWLLITFFIISAISVTNAKISGLAWFRLLKLAEFILFFFYIKSNLGKLINLTSGALVIVGSGLFQALIAIIQYLKQGSIGLKYLGESQIGVEITNVAVFFASNGNKYLRSYGTFPHPNVLSAWLILAIFALYFIFLTRNNIGRKKLLIAYAILLFGFFFTFSRTVIGLWGLAFVIGAWVLVKQGKKITPLIFSTLIIGTVFSVIFWPQVKARALISSDEEAVTQRIYYNEIAGEVIKKNPIFGIGIGQFVANMKKDYRYYPSYFYQPVHNIYLYISSETGLIGLISFLIFLSGLFWYSVKTRGRNDYGLLIISGCLLVSGLFDHFLWTLQQGSFTLWMVLAVLGVDKALD